MTLVDVLLVAFGAVTIGAGLRVVTTAHLVRAGLWLVVALGGLAGCFLVLAAEFLAWAQVLVYVGAVVVLMLFAMMLTRAPIGPDPDADRRRLPAAICGAGAGLGLAAALVDAFGARRVDLADVRPGTPEAIGEAVFGTWVLPFELLSVLVLSALVGAVTVASASRRRRS